MLLETIIFVMFYLAQQVVGERFSAFPVIKYDYKVFGTTER